MTADNEIHATPEKRTDYSIEEMQSIWAKHRQDMKQVWGGWARNGTIRRAPLVAVRMGYDYVRTLDCADLVRMVCGADTADLTPEEIDDFACADLVIEAVEWGGEATIYIAMEISYTANRSDTRRAIRNAALLTRFTGQPARPAVGSLCVRKDPELDALIADGGVYYHRVSERHLELY